MKIYTHFLLLSLIALLAGCAGLSKSECLALDWQQVGFEDGSKGLNPSNISSFQESCGKFDVVVDNDAYNQGHAQGVPIFCAPENGYDYGKSGYQYAVSCPTAFNTEYRIGYEIYVAQSNITQIESVINSNEVTIGKLQTAIGEAFLRLDSGLLSVSEENQVRLSIESMESQILNYESDSDRLIPALHDRQEVLERLREQHGRE